MPNFPESNLMKYELHRESSPPQAKKISSILMLGILWCLCFVWCLWCFVVRCFVVFCGLVFDPDVGHFLLSFSLSFSLSSSSCFLPSSPFSPPPAPPPPTFLLPPLVFPPPFSFCSPRPSGRPSLPPPLVSLSSLRSPCFSLPTPSPLPPLPPFRVLRFFLRLCCRFLLLLLCCPRR